MAIKKRGLGRGLDALLGGGNGGAASPDSGEDLSELDVTLLSPGKHQPRRNFDAAALDTLADSIKAQGLQQPIVVRPMGGGYEIVAGERRWRAVQKLGHKTIQAIVRSMDDRAAMAVSLIENMQREGLNALEEANGLKKLIDEYGLTHEQCSAALGFSRAQVTNLLRLFELNEDVQALLRAGKLTLGHAKVLLGIAGPRQSSMASLVVARQLSVRQTEDMVRAALAGRATGKKKPSRSPLENDLTQKLGLTVRLQAGSDGGGKLTIRYRQKSELDKLLRLFR
jgi:ParB family chromosome partitioning protein